jgi:hypothetical protein
LSDPAQRDGPDAVAASTTHGGRKAAMSFILIAVLIDMVSIGLIIPVLPPNWRWPSPSVSRISSGRPSWAGSPTASAAAR